MSMPESKSICERLFGNNSKEIFQNVKINNKTEHQNYIDACLQLSMKVCSLLFEREDALMFFSGAEAANEACPLYAYRLVAIKECYSQKSEAERLSFSEENRFLLLSLFLNTILLSGMPIPLVGVFQKVIKDNALQLPGKNPRFKEFLYDDGKGREYASRKAFNVLFESYIKAKLREISLHSPVFKELSDLAEQDLTVSYPSFRNQKLYTFPIFGILLFLSKQIEEGRVGVILRLKVITQDGVVGYIQNTVGNIKAAANPVIVFNGLATDGSFGIVDYRKDGILCPHNYFHKQQQRFLHPKEGCCFYCKKHASSTDPVLRVFKERCSKVLENLKELFNTMAVDAILSDMPLLNRIENGERFSELKKLVDEYRLKVGLSGLSSQVPTTFAIATVHLNTAEREGRSGFYLDKTPELLISEFVNGS